jgi:phosphate transport system substrate-binding protein
MRRAGGLAVVVVVGLALAAPARAAPTITLSGSVVVKPLVADLAYFYRHDVRDPAQFSIAGGVTASGISDAQRRVVDAGMVARDLTPADPPGLVLTRLALSGLCLVTNRANPVPAIGRAQIQDIVAGRVSRWSQIPGSPRSDPIIAVGLATTTGSAQVFLSDFVDLDTPLGYRPITLPADPDVRDYVAKTPGAFGYVDVALTGPLHVMAYEAIGCTRATIRAGTYPARRPLGVVTRGRPHGALARFLRWVKTSRKARRVIATRYVPT